MFKHFFLFELKYRLKQPMVYIFFLVIFLLFYGVTVSDNIVIGSRSNAVNINSPFIIQTYSALISLLGVLMIAAFMITSALRDFSYNYNQILFSSPIKKSGYFLGRFLGASIFAIIPFLGVFAGIIIGCLTPWAEAEKVGSFFLEPYINSLLIFIIPNTLILGAILFSIAFFTRSMLYSFIGAIGLLVAYSLAGNYVSDLDNEMIGMLLDPFAIGTHEIITKYWTIEEKNTLSVGLSGIMLLNRFIWIFGSAVLLVLSYFKFSFTESHSLKKSKKEALKATANEEQNPFFQVLKPLPKVTINHSSETSLYQLWTQFKTEFLGLIKSTPFIVIMVFAVVNMLMMMSTATSMYGTTTHPVTYNVISTIKNGLFVFVVAIIIFYSGVLVWKERDAKMEQFFDALPFPSWVPFTAKYLALVSLVGVIMILAIFVGIGAQLYYGFDNIGFIHYIREFLVLDLTGFAILAALAMFLHTVINNKYIAYFAIAAVIMANGFLWNALNVESNMLIFNGRPSYIFSDMNGYGPFVSGLFWFRSYWLLIAIGMCLISLLFWVRSSGSSFKQRLTVAGDRFKSQYKLAFLSLLGLWIPTAGYLFYNTKIVNKIEASNQIEERSSDYEKNYKKYEGVPQPRIIAVKNEIDIFPAERDLEANVELVIKNKSTEIIDSLHLTIDKNVETSIELNGAKLIHDDQKLEYQIYSLNPPMQPGEERVMKVHSKIESNGFENQVSQRSIVSNGSFFNNKQFMPQIGYQADNELDDKSKRIKKELPKRARMPKLTHNCSKACTNNYITNNADWISLETTISTSSDQMAIAPGTLTKEWKENGRNYYTYILEHKALNFYSFISADYKVKKENWNGVEMAVYYYKEHEYNVDKMLKAIGSSLKYYTENFGPYPHKQARIIEFPRYASFAQAFPGTMPYSEGIGFIANLEDEEDIDFVHYVVAHEMAHQWWAHQVIGAEMQGSVVFSESFAQYSALMVMEKEYGKDKMRQFMEYEMDRYLRSRGAESEKELPLMKSETQPYIYYQKASVVMYALKEYLGEENLNKALADFLAATKYKEPPYPNIHTLMPFMYQAAPDSMAYLIKDMFEEITLFGNKGVEATYKELDSGKYEVNFKVEAHKFKADSLGKEVEVELNDWIDIGVYGDLEEGKSLPPLIAQKRVKITQIENEFTMLVSQKPYKAGIDPNHLLIDRMPEDNMKKLSLVEAN